MTYPVLPSGSSGYQIQRSVRLRASASAYFSRTAGAPTSPYIWTVSAWLKLGSSPGGNSFCLLGGGNTTPNFLYSYIDLTTGTFQLFAPNTGTTLNLITTQVFRDYSSWYHFVISVDTTQATASNRVKIYVNGSQITAFSTATYPALNATFFWNQNGVVQRLGSISGVSGFYDGYYAEMIGVDGQQLTPTSFGEFSPVTGVWIPKGYTGTYGTNGFFLKFTDNSAATAAAIGKDYSGNGNNWTPNNISVTAGVTYDSMLDVPTLNNPTAANFAVWNPLNNPASATFADGNLKITNSAGDYRGCLSTMSIPSSGKFYWESQSTATSGTFSICNMGIAPLGIPLSGNQNGYANSAAWYLGNAAAAFWIPGGISVGASSPSDVFQFAYDATTGKVWLGRNNVWYWGNTTTNNTTGDPSGGTNPTFTLTSAEFYAWAFAYANGSTINFGQRPFTYTPPTAFKSLNTFNLTTPSIPNGTKQMGTLLWTGAGTTGAGSITGLNFQPDFVWSKVKSTTYNHTLFNSVVGGGVKKGLSSSSALSEAAFNDDAGIGYLTTFDANGFSYIGGTAPAYFSANAQTYVGWNWKGSNATAVSNTSGSVTSSVSANPTAGFSVVTWTAPASGAYTVGHGLNVAPSLILVKDRANSVSWIVYHKSVSTTTALYLVLNSTAAIASAAGIWGSALPTSSVFGNTAGTGVSVNAASLAYCFAEIAGYSKFGSFTGNGSADGPFIYTGFRPSFICIKRSDVASGWIILDSTRSPYNVADKYIFAEATSGEGTLALEDFLSNGFKIRSTSSSVNTSSGTYIYFAFAESPFNYSLSR